MSFDIATLTLETFLLVVVRTGCFVAIAPIFGHKSVNARLRILIAACISLSVFSAFDVSLIQYDSVLGYTLLVIKEAVVGLSLGFVSSLVMSILVLAGEFIDREIGFTMVTTMGATSGSMVTITSELYDKLVCLIMVITNLHYFILKAIARSFEVIPLGNVKINLVYLYSGILDCIIQYFSIGFRIAMPIFLGTTILNVILGILSKSSPQMNMFAIGMQLKVLFGLIVLSMAILFVPNITNYMVEHMSNMLSSLMGGF